MTCGREAAIVRGSLSLPFIRPAKTLEAREKPGLKGSVSGSRITRLSEPKRNLPPFLNVSRSLGSLAEAHASTAASAAPSGPLPVRSLDKAAEAASPKGKQRLRESRSQMDKESKEIVSQYKRLVMPVFGGVEYRNHRLQAQSKFLDFLDIKPGQNWQRMKRMKHKPAPLKGFVSDRIEVDLTGQVGEQEAAVAITEVRHSSELFHAADANKDLQLDFAEFKVLLASMLETKLTLDGHDNCEIAAALAEKSEAQMHDWFDSIDDDGNGYISMTEWFAVSLREAIVFAGTSASMDTFFAYWGQGKEGDGKVSVREFKRLARHLGFGIVADQLIDMLWIDSAIDEKGRIQYSHIARTLRKRSSTKNGRSFVRAAARIAQKRQKQGSRWAALSEVLFQESRKHTSMAGAARRKSTRVGAGLSLKDDAIGRDKTAGSLAQCEAQLAQVELQYEARCKRLRKTIRALDQLQEARAAGRELTAKEEEKLAREEELRAELQEAESELERLDGGLAQLAGTSNVRGARAEHDESVDLKKDLLDAKLVLDEDTLRTMHELATQVEKLTSVTQIGVEDPEARQLFNLLRNWIRGRVASQALDLFKALDTGRDWTLSERELGRGLETLGFRAPKHVLQLLYDEIRATSTEAMRTGRGFDFPTFKAWLMDVEEEDEPGLGEPSRLSLLSAPGAPLAAAAAAGSAKSAARTKAPAASPSATAKHARAQQSQGGGPSWRADCARLGSATARDGAIRALSRAADDLYEAEAAAMAAELRGVGGVRVLVGCLAPATGDTVRACAASLLGNLLTDLFDTAAPRTLGLFMEAGGSQAVIQLLGGPPPLDLYAAAIVQNATDLECAAHEDCCAALRALAADDRLEALRNSATADERARAFANGALENLKPKVAAGARPASRGQRLPTPDHLPRKKTVQLAVPRVEPQRRGRK